MMSSIQPVGVEVGIQEGAVAVVAAPQVILPQNFIFMGELPPWHAPAPLRVPVWGPEWAQAQRNDLFHWIDAQRQDPRLDELWDAEDNLFRLTNWMREGRDVTFAILRAVLLEHVWVINSLIMDGYTAIDRPVWAGLTLLEIAVLAGQPESVRFLAGFFNEAERQKAMRLVERLQVECPTLGVKRFGRMHDSL